MQQTRYNSNAQCDKKTVRITESSNYGKLMKFRKICWCGQSFLPLHVQTYLPGSSGHKNPS